MNNHSTLLSHQDVFTNAANLTKTQPFHEAPYDLSVCLLTCGSSISNGDVKLLRGARMVLAGISHDLNLVDNRRPRHSGNKVITNVN